jgi:tripartite-type tricarboxylate transporter receptor subunit TctC
MQSGKLHALAVTSRMRLDTLPSVPAISETVPGYEARGWIGIGALKNTPTSIIEKLNQQTDTIIADASFDKRLANYVDAPMSMNPVQFKTFIADETEKWAKVVKFANIKPE